MAFDASKAKTAGKGSSNEGGSLTFIKASKLFEEKKFDEVILEGVYEGSVPNKLTEKEDFKFTTDEGDTVIINATGHLTHLMKDVSPGNACQVKYLGKKDIKGKAVHQFNVDYY